MKTYNITRKEIIINGVLYICSFSFLFGTAPSGKNDSWISIILSAVLSIPIILAIHLLFTYPGKNFFEAIESVLGKVLGKISIIMLTILNVVIMNFSILKVVDFIQIVLLFYTPIVVILGCLLITVFYMLHKSSKVMVNFGEFIFVLTVLFLLISTTFILKNARFHELLPIAHKTWKNIAKGTIEALASSFSIIIFLPCLFENLRDRKKMYKPLGAILALSLIMILILSTNNLTVLGGSQKSEFFFPKHELHRMMALGTMFQRTEILLSSLFILTEIFKLSLYTYFLLTALHHLLPVSNYKILIIPTLLMIANNAISQYQSILVPIDKERICLELIELSIIYSFSFIVIFISIFKKLFKT